MRLHSFLRRALRILPAAALILALTVPAFADVWIPPDENMNMSLVGAPWDEEDCKPLNIFLSNYIEAGLLDFEDNYDTADALMLTTVLKHIELNGLAKSTYEQGGKTCMEITPERLASSAMRLFHTGIDAEGLPGYRNGALYVTAENYKAAPQVLASAEYVDYRGESLYVVFFTVYQGRNANSYYGTPMSEIEDAPLTSIGSGRACVRYAGSTSDLDIRVEDLLLVWLEAELDGGASLPYQTANAPAEPPSKEPAPKPVTDPEPAKEPDPPKEPEPYQPVPPTPAQPPEGSEGGDPPGVTEPPKQADPPGPEDAPPASDPGNAEPSPAPVPPAAPAPQAPDQPARSGFSALTLIAVAVAAAAVAALAAVLILFRKKK